MRRVPWELRESLTVISGEGCSRQGEQQETRALALDEFGNEKVPVGLR